MPSKPKRINHAKSLIAQPLFRSRQEKPKKGKGSYQRKASRNWEAFCFLTGYFGEMSEYAAERHALAPLARLRERVGGASKPIFPCCKPNFLL